MLLLSGRAATAAYRRFTRSATCSTRCSDACWHFRRPFVNDCKRCGLAAGSAGVSAVLISLSTSALRGGRSCRGSRRPSRPGSGPALSTRACSDAFSDRVHIAVATVAVASAFVAAAARPGSDALAATRVCAAAFARKAQPRASLRSTEQRLVTDAYRPPTPSVARDTPPAPTKKDDRARESRARATHPVDLGHRVPLQPPRHALRARANERTPRAGSAHLFVGAERLRALDETAAARVRVLRAEPVRDARRRIEARTAVSGACAPAAAKHSKNAFACFAQPLGASGK